MSVLLAWGSVLFMPNKQSFDNLKHNMNFGWQKQAAINSSPLYQATQEIDYSLSITGSIYTEKAGHDQMLNRLKKQGSRQKAYMMADGNGRVYGKFILLSLDGTDSHHLDKAIPLKQEYTLNFAHIGSGHKLLNLF